MKTLQRTENIFRAPSDLFSKALSELRPLSGNHCQITEKL